MKKNTKLDLKKYQEIRKEKISVFGYSADFDWSMIVLLGLILLILVFFFSINELRHTINYDPEPDTSTQNLLLDKSTIEKIDKIIEDFDSKETTAINEDEDLEE
jgi:hypothetical protein